MKKWLLTFPLLTISLACGQKQAEVEMQLPTLTATATVLASPTADTPSPTSTTGPPVLQYFIEDFKGTVLIIPSDSNLPESVAEGETVDPGDELITKDDSEATLALNDHTLVHLSANSQVTVADLTPSTSKGFKSRIELLVGSILSEVEKLGESQSSFEIEAGGVVCAVRGTAFEVQKQGNNVSTSTFHGMVEMQKGGNFQQVHTNEHSTFSLKKSGFLPQRVLNHTEKKHYQVWLKKKVVAQQKRTVRIANHMPAPIKSSHKDVSIRVQKRTVVIRQPQRIERAQPHPSVSRKRPRNKPSLHSAPRHQPLSRSIHRQPQQRKPQSRQNHSATQKSHRKKKDN